MGIIAGIVILLVLLSTVAKKPKTYTPVNASIYRTQIRQGHYERRTYSPFTTIWESPKSNEESKYNQSYIKRHQFLRYNPGDNKWEYAHFDDTLRYNYLEDQWAYTEPGENLRYNSFQNQWEYAEPKDRLRYNYLENDWQYVSPNARLRYNPFEDEWEWTKPD